MASKGPHADSRPTHPIVPDFPADAFAGTAEHYAQFRPPYPAALIEELRSRTGVTGESRVIDLACGTGQVALSVAPFVGEVWALDREAEMIAVGRQEAAARGIDNVDWKAGRAEDLEAPAGAFALVTTGNAFHRLHRRLVGAKAMEWLVPGGHLAVLGSTNLWTGPEDWHAPLREALRRWRPAPADASSGSTEGQADQLRETFEEALAHAGYEGVEERLYPQSHVWSLDSLIGYLRSTSLYSQHCLGEAVVAFEADVRQTLLAYDSQGEYRETIEFFLILARKPVKA